MRAGKLDTLISIRRSTTTVNEYGEPSFTSVEIATARAQVIQSSTEEFLRGYGESSDKVVIFRTRFIDEVRNTDEVISDGLVFNIKETKEIGRRRGLEIRTVSVGEAA